MDHAPHQHRELQRKLTAHFRCLIGLLFAGSLWLECASAASAADVSPPPHPSPAKTRTTPKPAAAKDMTKETATNQPPSIKLESHRAVFDGVELGTYATLNAGEEKVAFQVPQGLITRFEQGGQFVAISRPGASAPAITVSYSVATDADAFKPESLAARVTSRFSAARFVSQFNTGAMGTNAYTFHLAIPAGAETWQGQVLFVPTRKGLLTVAATAAPAAVQETLGAMQQIVNSLQSTGPDGRVHFPEPQLFP